jgi:hypothetical protein
MITYSDGEYRFHYDEDDHEVASALKQIFLTTEVGRDFKANYNTNATGEANYEKILNAAVRIAGGPMITEGILLHALTLLIDSGEIKRKGFTPAAQLDEPEEDTRPRDKNGKVLTPQQIQWSSFRQFVETGGQRLNSQTGQLEPTGGPASMDEINRKKQSDPEFANYVRKALQTEMNQEIGDAVTPAGEPTTKTRANQDLVDFARKYNQEPSQNLKPRGGVVLLAGEQIPYPQFIELVNKATAARLL